MFKSLINKLKDTGTQMVAAWISNKYLHPLGTMTHLQIDSARQEISMTLALHGEQSPIELTVRYEILSPGQMEIKHVSSSRQWIATLVNELLPAEKKRIVVPPTVTAALAKLIQ